VWHVAEEQLASQNGLCSMEIITIIIIIIIKFYGVLFGWPIKGAEIGGVHNMHKIFYSYNIK
jgi:hypothetical protein